MIERNRLSMGIANYTLHPGNALSVIHAPCPEPRAPSAYGGILPDPDRVFVGGGGGKDLPALLTACLKNEVLFRYFDPWTGAEKTITAHPTVDTVSVLLDDGGTHWWRGFRVTMRAK